MEISSAYKTVKEKVGKLQTYIQMNGEGLTLEAFDKIAAVLRELVSKFGKDPELNAIYKGAPRLVFVNTGVFLDTARMCLLDPTNAARKNKLNLKKEQVFGDIESVLGNLGGLSSSAPDLKRTPQTTDNIQTQSPVSPRTTKQLSQQLPARGGFSMRTSGTKATDMPTLSASSSNLGNHRVSSGANSPSAAVRSGSGTVKVAQLKSRASQDNGNDVNKADKMGRTALMVASLKGDEEKVKSLLKSGAQVNLQDKYGCSAFLMASSKNFWNICMDLLDAGADPNVSSDTWGSSAMDYFYGKNPSTPQQIEVISKMIDGGCDVNKGFQFKYGDTLLMLACVCNNIPYATMLLDKPNINVDVTNKFGETALIKCARMANFALTNLLVSRGANASIEGDHGTALSVLPANCAKRAEIVNLLKAKAKPPSLSPRGSGSAAKKLNTRTRRLVDPVQRMTLQAKNNDLSKMLDKMLSEENNQTIVTSPVAQRINQNQVVSLTKSPMLRVEEEVLSASEPPVIEETFEPFRNMFFKKACMNFACYSDLLIVTILFTGKEGVHKSLVMSPDGHQIIDIPEDTLRAQKGSKLPDKCLTYLSTIMYPGKTWWAIDDASSKTFSLELLGLEVSHASNASAFRIAVVYCGENQTTEEQFFKNQKSSPAFEEFLNMLGDKISLNGFSGFSGGFDEVEEKEQESYYCSFQNLEIMFHVSTLMSGEEQRRLIGNDLVIIYFTESKTPFMPLEFRGSVNSLGIVVRAVGENEYQMGCFARRQIKEFGPPCISRFSIGMARTYILTKAINGILAAQKSPPLCKMIASLYNTDIERILVNYLPKKATKK